jgi:hypothetical protein
MGVGVIEVIFEKLLAVDHRLALFVAGRQRRINRGLKQVLAVDAVTSFGKEANIAGRSCPNVQHAKGILRLENAPQFGHGA